jgi:hypothetical protein
VQLALKVHPRRVFSLGLILTAMLGRYRRRSILALTLMVAQSFLYNSVFRTFGLIISNFYHVPDEQVGLYLFPFGHRQFLWIAAAGTVGRKKMIAGSFTISGVFLLVTAYMFGAGLLSATTQTIAWCTIFFFASAAASSAYLTASEIFPLKMCAGHCLLLRARHGHWRQHFAPPILADRIRIGLAGELRIRNAAAPRGGN